MHARSRTAVPRSSTKSGLSTVGSNKGRGCSGHEFRENDESRKTFGYLRPFYLITVCGVQKGRTCWSSFILIMRAQPLFRKSSAAFPTCRRMIRRNALAHPHDLRTRHEDSQSDFRRMLSLGTAEKKLKFAKTLLKRVCGCANFIWRLNFRCISSLNIIVMEVNPGRIPLY